MRYLREMIRAAVVLAVLLPLTANAEPEQGEPEAEVEGTDERETSYSFGSYGRVGVGSDLRGSSPEAINIVQHGSRLDVVVHIAGRGQRQIRLPG